MEILKIILISLIISIIVDRTQVELKYKKSRYLVVYNFQTYTGNIYIDINTFELTYEVIEKMRQHIIEVNNLDKSEKIIILNIIQIKE